MIGNLDDFRAQVNKKMKNTLSYYTPEIKSALEPAMLVTKSQVKDRETKNKENIVEDERIS